MAGIESALEMLTGIIRIITDPEAPAKLATIHRAIQETVDAATGEPAEAEQKKAKRGTCPKCGRKYGINKAGTVRRHNGEYEACQFEHQPPAELIPAILAIAQLGDASGEGSKDDRPGSEHG